MPSSMPVWLVALDSTLGKRGINYKTKQGEYFVDDDGENIFLRSILWKTSCLLEPANVLQEKDYETPECLGNLRSAEGVRSLTDKEETAQWFGGYSIPTNILHSLMYGVKQVSNNLVVVHNPFLYDGALEIAAMGMKLSFPTTHFAVKSTTTHPSSFRFGVNAVKDSLLEARLRTCLNKKLKPCDPM
jgi:hypothetical protein